MSRRTYAIYAITRHGVEIALRLRDELPNADLFVSRKLLKLAPSDVKTLALPMGPTLSETWQSYDCHIHIISVGAVVRMIAPLMVNKKVDPAVVCIDDAGQYAICLLSGHVGRGNAFTQRIASAIEATPVITTASDVRGTLTVDILGRELGWTLADPDRNVTAGCAAVVNEERVLFVQETGEPDWWPLDRPLPPGVEYSTTIDQVRPTDYGMLLIASDRLLEQSHPEHFKRAVIYRPKTLVLGIGCDRGTPQEQLERGVQSVLASNGLSMACISAVATIDLKRDEVGLLGLCRDQAWPMEVFPAQELDRVEGVQNPSDVVKEYVGTKSVGEAACLLASGAQELLIPKTKYSEEGLRWNLTIAVARRTFESRPQEPMPLAAQ